MAQPEHKRPSASISSLAIPGFRVDVQAYESGVAHVPKVAKYIVGLDPSVVVLSSLSCLSRYKAKNVEPGAFPVDGIQDLEGH